MALEQENVGGAHLDGSAQDALAGVEQGVHQVLELHAGAQQGVAHEHHYHHDDGNAHHPAAGLDEQQDGQGADDDVEGVQTAALVDQLIQEVDLIAEGADGQSRQHDVVPGHVVDPGDAPLLDGVHHIYEHQDQAQEPAAADAAVHAGEHAHVHHEDHKGRHGVPDDLFGQALPNLGVGLPVILFHDLFHVGRGAYVHVNGGCIHGLFFFLFHSCSPPLSRTLERLVLTGQRNDGISAAQLAQTDDLGAACLGLQLPGVYADPVLDVRIVLHHSTQQQCPVRKAPC